MEEVGCVAVQCSLEVCRFPDFSWTLTSLGVGVRVCVFEVFSLRLFFPLLAVNVVVCPIIYLFVGVVCVLANSFTNIFNL